jgi:hypothetical protein
MTDSNGTKSDAEKFVEAAVKAASKSDASDKEKSPKQADLLIKIASDGAEFFHTPDGEAYADIVVEGHRKTHRVRGSVFQNWLRHQYYKMKRGGVSGETMQTAIGTICSMAQYEGPEREVYIRACGSGEAIYIDLGDRDWRAVEVTASGWKVVNDPPVRFLRTSIMRALPVPQPGGSIKELRPFFNVSKDGFVLVAGFIFAAFRPGGRNYPILIIIAEQGAAKSTMIGFLVDLIDPQQPKWLPPPRNEDDLIVTAKSAHLMPYDNIGEIGDHLSDSLCRLSTGGGHSKRKLWTDDDRVSFNGQRPIILAGIEDIATRPDLLDRAFSIKSEFIPDEKRKSEDDLLAEFAAVAPKIFGALLDGLVAGLRNAKNLQIPSLPRMADVTRWGEACTQAYWKEGTFVDAYRRNISRAVHIAIEASPVAGAIVDFVKTLSMDAGGQRTWRSTATALLEALTTSVGDKKAKERGWPKRPNTLSSKLRLSASSLRRVGLVIDLGEREGRRGERIISIRASRTFAEEFGLFPPSAIAKTSSHASASSAEGNSASSAEGNRAQRADATDDWDDDSSIAEGGKSTWAPKANALGTTTTGSAPPSNMRPDGGLRFEKTGALPADEPCAECRVSNDKVWYLADSLNPDLAPEVLHFHCAPIWFDRAASDAAAANDINTAPAAASGIPFMMTNDLKSRLSVLGFTVEQISNMKPAQAHEILVRAEAALAAVTPPSPTASLLPTTAPDACAKCVDTDGGDTTGALATYHLRTREKDGVVFLDLWECDGPGAVKLHSSCRNAWHRAEAKRQGLQLGYLVRPQ